jgi:hypothetical protein
VGADAITTTVPELTPLPHATCDARGAPCLLVLLNCFDPRRLTDWRESGRRIHTPPLLFSCSDLPCPLPSTLILSLLSKLILLIATMASNLPHPRLRTKADLVVLRQVLGWQALGYDSWLQCGTLSLVNLRLGAVHLLCLLRYSQAFPASVLLPPYTDGVLRAPSSAPVAALLYSSGDLCPLLRDVRRRAAVSPPILAIPRVALDREQEESDRHLLLPAPSQGTG